MVDKTRGSGIHRFSVGALSSGETEVYNFRELEVNGVKGYFRPFLPLDTLVVVNQSSEDMSIKIGEMDFWVPSNSTKSYTEQGFTYVEITNEGGTSISSGEVTIEVKRAPYNSDKRARELKRRGPIRSMIKKFTGV